MSIDDEIKAVVRAELAAALPVAIREAFAGMFQGDRRAEPRPVTKRQRGGKANRTCPIPGCTNGWTPRNGGVCAAHLNTAAHRKLKAAREKGAKKR